VNGLDEEAHVMGRIVKFGERSGDEGEGLEVGERGAERRGLLEDGSEFILEAGTVPWVGVQSLGNGTFFHSVSYLPHSGGDDAA